MIPGGGGGGGGGGLGGTRLGPIVMLSRCCKYLLQISITRRVRSRDLNRLYNTSGVTLPSLPSLGDGSGRTGSVPEVFIEKDYLMVESGLRYPENGLE